MPRSATLDRGPGEGREPEPEAGGGAREGSRSLENLLRQPGLGAGTGQEEIYMDMRGGEGRVA
jgi:hypothetical protein